MEPLFTPEQLADVRGYHASRYVWLSVRDALTVLTAFLTIKYLTGPMFAFSERCAEQLARRKWLPARRVLRPITGALDRFWRGRGWLTALTFSLGYLLVTRALFLPLTVYFGYVLEKQHGLSSQSLASFAAHEAKAFTLSAIAVSLTAVTMYGFARRTRLWWLILGITTGCGMLFASGLDPYESRVYYDQAPLEEGALKSDITGLLERAKAPVARILVDKTSVASARANAYFAGQGPTRSIVLNDVLVSTFDREEVLAVVAHEAAHLQESAAWKRYASALSMFFVLFMMERLMRAAAARRWLGIHEPSDVRTLPLLILMMSVLTGVAAPISNAYSRQQELKADLYALKLLRDEGPVLRMLYRLGRLNKLDPDPPKWIVWRWASHPPIADRIANVQRASSELLTTD